MCLALWFSSPIYPDRGQGAEVAHLHYQELERVKVRLKTKVASVPGKFKSACWILPGHQFRHASLFCPCSDIDMNSQLWALQLLGCCRCSAESRHTFLENSNASLALPSGPVWDPWVGSEDYGLPFLKTQGAMET